MPLSTLMLLAAAIQTQPAYNCDVNHINPATLVHLRIGSPRGTPSAQEQATSPVAEVSLSGNGGKVLGYTRIGVRYEPCGEQRDIRLERRDGLKRFLFGKHALKSLSIDVKVWPLDVKQTRQLALIKRDSTKKGEEWSTEVVNDEIILPYFRVDRSSTVTIQASVGSSRTYESSAAADILKIVQDAAGIISPTTPLITTENKPRFNEAAGFIDASVNGLLRVAIDEKAHSKVALNSPGKEQVLAVITLALPMANNSFGTPKPIGRWTIYAEKYRSSMLADAIDAGPLQRSQTSVAAVLNYLVDDKKTVREFLAGSKSLGSARDAVVAASAKDVADKARTLCRALVSEVDALGLAPVDSGAVAWAYLADLALGTEKNSAAESGCAAIELYPPSQE